MRRQDSNLRPPGYELLKVVFSVAAVGIFALFHGKPGGHESIKICPVHCVMIPYGSKHGSKMWSCYGSANQAAFTAEFGLTTHLRPLWIHFSGGCVDRVFKRFFTPVFEPSAGAGRFSSSAGNLLSRFQHGSKTWVRQFPSSMAGSLSHPKVS